MEYALCSLGHRRTAILPAYFPAGTIRPTKATTTTLTRRSFQLSSNRLFISMFNFSGHLYKNGLNPITRPNVVACFASNDRDGLESCNNYYLDREKRMVNMTRTIVLACVVGLISLGFGNNKALSGMRPEMLHPTEGQYAITSLMEVSEYLSHAKELKLSKSKFKFWKSRSRSNQPNKPSKNDVEELKKQAVKTMKSGKPDKAVDELTKEFELWKSESEPALNIAMALIPILIHMGRYKDAMKYVTFIEELQKKYNPPIHSSYTLYKAIIYTMLYEDDEKNEQIALKCWDTFKETMFKASVAASPPSDG